MVKTYKEGKFSNDLVVTREGIVETKRLVLSWGEDVACYQYGGVDHVPCPWPEELREVYNLMRKDVVGKEGGAVIMREIKE